MMSLSDEQKNRLLQARSAEEAAVLLKEAGVDAPQAERIWNEISAFREDKEEKREHISKIYREIIDRDEQCSSSIREWAKTHRILSHSGDFLPASELTYITVDGFKNSKRV